MAVQASAWHQNMSSPLPADSEVVRVDPVGSRVELGVVVVTSSVKSRTLQTRRNPASPLCLIMTSLIYKNKQTMCLCFQRQLRVNMIVHACLIKKQQKTTKTERNWIVNFERIWKLMRQKKVPFLSETITCNRASKMNFLKKKIDPDDENWICDRIWNVNVINEKKMSLLIRIRKTRPCRRESRRGKETGDSGHRWCKCYRNHETVETEVFHWWTQLLNCSLCMALIIIIINTYTQKDNAY